jgi:hypothetical protein
MFEAVGQPLGDPQQLLDGDSNRMPASEVSHPPSKPTCTGLPATKPVRILYLPPWPWPWPWRGRTPLSSDGSASADAAHPLNIVNIHGGGKPGSPITQPAGVDVTHGV